jgi:hypothetical protein
MGKKKSSQHLTQSMGQMVSRAALAQLGPDIEKMVRHYIKNLGNQLAVQQASTLETLFSRVVVLESIIMEKLGYTTEDLTNKVADVEDEKEGFAVSDSAAELNDIVRLEIRTKTADQPEYQGSSRLKIYQTGSGGTIGQELEAGILGMKAGETKEVKFGKDQAMTAELKIDRVSRQIPAPAAPEAAPEGQANADQAQG